VSPGPEMRERETVISEAGDYAFTRRGTPGSPPATQAGSRDPRKPAVSRAGPSEGRARDERRTTGDAAPERREAPHARNVSRRFKSAPTHPLLGRTVRVHNIGF
jgi:hypothetical protein